MFLLSMNTEGKRPNHFASQLSLKSVDSGKRTLKGFLFFQIYKLGILPSDTNTLLHFYIFFFFLMVVFFYR